MESIAIYTRLVRDGLSLHYELFTGWGV